MATPAQKLAESLAVLEELQRDGRRVFRSQEFTRTHRTRLVRQGFLSRVMKGWLISSTPAADAGDSTAWYASFWEFCASYCASRFGDEWHLSPEQSLLLHAEDTVIPDQLVIHAPKGTNNSTALPFGTSLFDVKRSGMPPSSDLVTRDGVRMYAPEVALIQASPAFFRQQPLAARVVLAATDHSSFLLARLLDGGHSRIAGRLAGAFRRLGADTFADEITLAMRAAGYDVRETDPFESARVPGAFASPRTPTEPIVQRLEAIWETCRQDVIDVFPAPPGRPSTPTDYLQAVDEIYGSDAYHSLSIEGYRVSRELVEKVASGDWNPDASASDRGSREALAARGYWDAFRQVKQTIEGIVAGRDPSQLALQGHRDWYRALFQPCVQAGLVPPSALAGYRSDAVYLRGSRHVPPRATVVPDAMTSLFDLLHGERSSAVRAVLGHWLFGYIHPYPDGNGRMARFIMNTMLASGGYPWTVVRVEDRAEYLSALEVASVKLDVTPFAAFIAARIPAE